MSSDDIDEEDDEPKEPKKFLRLEDLVASVSKRATDTRPGVPLSRKEHNDSVEAQYRYTRYVFRVVSVVCECGQGYHEQTGLFLESAPTKGGMRKQVAVIGLVDQHKNLPREIEVESVKIPHCQRCLLDQGFKVVNQ